MANKIKSEIYTFKWTRSNKHHQFENHIKNSYFSGSDNLLQLTVLLTYTSKLTMSLWKYWFSRKATNTDFQNK